MLAWRPGARSAVAERDPESSDARDGAPFSPRLGRGRCRPAADLDMKIHLEKNLEEERQILLQQQKICRNRARKYFVESNRRKKAFEEKRKEQEEREQQIREQILQQRKEKFEEVTEKFQRAHIPLSQRRGAVFQKPVPPLEEALKQIQESNLKSEVNLLPSHRPTINWRAIDNALPSSLSKNGHKHQKHLLSKINCGKEMKENNRANLATNKDAFQLKLEETQKLLEDQHLSTLQKFCDEVNQITNSETLSSIDSLEAGEHEEIYLTLNKEPSTSNQKDSISLKSVNLQSTNVSCCDEDKLAFSKSQHINNWLINVSDPDTQTVTPFSDSVSKPDVLPSCECFNSKEQNPPVERVTNSADNSVAFVYSPTIFVQDGKGKAVSETSTMRTTDSSSGTFQRERPFVTESPTFKLSRVWASPDRLTQGMATFSDQGNNSELTQENRPTSFVPTATRIVLPCNMQSARPLPKSSLHIKEVDPVQCSDTLGELTDVKDEKLKYFHCNKEELPLFSDDFQVVYIPHNSDSNDKKHKIAQTSISVSTVISNCDLVGQHKKMKYNTPERNGVRFLKGILKKESKYEHNCFKALVINHSFKLGNQKAAAIRDSIELTKEKGTEIPKTIKKLRWFDETGDTDKNAADGHSLKNRIELCQQWSQPFHIQTKSGAASKVIRVPACAVGPADGTQPKEGSVSEKVAALGEPATDHARLNCFMPSGYNVAKQAWPPSKKEGTQAPVHGGGSKAQKANPQRGGARVIRRTRSAQVQSAFVCAHRKGTGLRPQSASKATRLSQAQGRLIVPHPPPQSPSKIRSGKSMQASQCQPVTLENSQNVVTRNYFPSKHVLPKEHRFNHWNQESSSPPTDACSDSVTMMPSLPCCSSECQTLAKVNGSDGTQVVVLQDGTSHSAHRCPVEESHPSVTLRTAREDSVPLWKRQKDILGQNEKAAGSTVVRRKRIVENKQRSLLELKRQNSGSAGRKCNEQMSNFGQSVQLSSSEPKHTIRGTSDVEEVSDSTSQFLMAENLVKASVPEDEILTVMNSKQLQKPNLALNKTQPFDICALSAEEQRILQSLGRLNERLYYVQEAICKNPSIKDNLQIIPLLNSQPRGSPSPRVGSRSQRKY
ncbi:centrosomal protein of 126 kDa [Ursus americanus]|uniref:Centrosomal protein of 126 kDa n=1 Tax=Ursus maritimus TaxID=29073 RepID=A0A8M1FV46_URSMA|nr:centrosomal protein of 126 kDa [Ursus maritimus]XP_045653588.1 centrosomal protein of 126 kDa [Ursus americanus]